jgi:hypothetical protein
MKPSSVKGRVRELREAAGRPLYEELVKYHATESKKSWVEVRRSLLWFLVVYLVGMVGSRRMVILPPGCYLQYFLRSIS